MQIPFKRSRRAQSGFALVTMMAFLVVSLIVFGSIMYMVTSNARVTGMNNTYNMNQAAAEGVAESIVAKMDRDFLFQSLNGVSVYTTPTIDQSSWPVQFQFSDTNGNVGQATVRITPQNWSTNWEGLNSQFTNLFGAVAECQVIVKAMATNNVSYQPPATVSESFQLAAIPIFQYGAFYNMNMDFSPGQPLTMNGKVMVNGILYMCPQALAIFNSSVAASIIVTNGDDPNDQQNLTFNSANLSYQGGNPLSGVDSLTMPIGGPNSNPTNIESILNLPPAGSDAPNANAYAPSNQVYLYNACDLIISNSVAGFPGAMWTNLTIYYQDKNSSPYWFTLTNNEICTFQKTNGPASLPAYWTTNSPYRPTTNYMRVASSFPFVTNVAFYDFREGKTVQAVQIDVALFNSWLTNTGFEGYRWNQYCGGSDGMNGTKGHPIDSIYVYSSIPLTGSQLPAVRVVNGHQLFSAKGLTIATPLPLYVLGDYNIHIDNSGNTSSQTTNTTWTYPAALMGDSITILSSSWLDNTGAYASGGSYGSRNAVTTTVNAAMLEGIVPSTKVGGTKHYSGGLENFLRMIENWNGDTLWYNGSIVVMFPSIYATNYWIAPQTYYDKPTRKWGFDANFTQQSKLPPLTPQVKAVIRGQWDAR